ncbi:hypothetical protein GCM10010260_31170 [Streptomyces filipinensis]|uniref:Uncharacterized protein n=1 Tax=Streptomyces filipinensis TaxID=66887 RepID=A0A918IAK8_9ACTN|nr:hypothetical protein [Streptomyces filipinensis]GGU93836.1 hypothetical protein GCM10010260_31170 [Streptomyces filipinensis]
MDVAGECAVLDELCLNWRCAVADGVCDQLADDHFGGAGGFPIDSQQRLGPLREVVVSHAEAADGAIVLLRVAIDHGQDAGDTRRS